MNVFLTGGTGFIGSYVAVSLCEEGHTVTILARNPDKIPALKKYLNVTFVKGDITDRALLKSCVTGMDACIHVALNYTRSTGVEVLSDDTLPTVALADACITAGVKHFIYTSSTAVNDCFYSGCDDVAQLGVKQVTNATRPRPATLYGATKAASENYLMALSYRSGMRMNFIRPGYVFGNPVIPGAPTQPDRRFADTVKAAAAGDTISVVKNDGTQFIWAGHLAELYRAVLAGDVNRKTYFGLSARFISWERIAHEALRQTGINGTIEVVDKGYDEGGLFWDVSEMEGDFGLKFDPWEKIVDHVAYWRESSGC